MKALKIILPILFVAVLVGCSVTVDFDGVMLERFTNRIAYLYNNCRSDIEGLQETMTPETIESMDQTCVASIKAITKVRGKIEKLKTRIGDSEIVNQILAKVDEILNSLQNSKDQITNLYNNYSSGAVGNFINNINGDELIQSLETLVDNYGLNGLN